MMSLPASNITVWSNCPTSSTPTSAYPWDWCGSGGGSGGTNIATTSFTTQSSNSYLYYHLINQVGNPINTQSLNEIIRIAKLCANDNGVIKIRDREECKIKLPDDTIIDIKIDGSFEIKDKDAKVTYRANRIRNFNTFINASDKLEAFIKFCGENGVKKDEMLQLPINLFIGWLILEAAKADEEPEPSIPLLPDLRKHTQQPRCKCGRFISREFIKKQIAFCRPLCFNKYYYKMTEVAT